MWIQRIFGGQEKNKKYTNTYIQGCRHQWSFPFLQYHLKKTLTLILLCSILNSFTEQQIKIKFDVNFLTLKTLCLLLGIVKEILRIWEVCLIIPCKNKIGSSNISAHKDVLTYEPKFRKSIVFLFKDSFFVI